MVTVSMLKSELGSRLAEQNRHLPPHDIDRIVDAILDTITDALTRGHRVELRGFGTFAVKKRRARTGRNPRTGAPVAMTEKAVPVFRTGKEMRQHLNQVVPRSKTKRAGAMTETG
jgi:integration host factor subunit beta